MKALPMSVCRYVCLSLSVHTGPSLSLRPLSQPLGSCSTNNSIRHRYATTPTIRILILVLGLFPILMLLWSLNYWNGIRRGKVWKYRLFSLYTSEFKFGKFPFWGIPIDQEPDPNYQVAARSSLTVGQDVWAVASRTLIDVITMAGPCPYGKACAPVL